MGHIVDTASGSYRANWRDAIGRQRSKTFRTKKEARAFLAQVEADLTRGSYVDPAAGRALFGDLAARWLAARNDEITTAARDASIMRTHVVPRWGSWPLGKIDHLAVQEWVSELAGRLAPATVAQCFRLMNAVTKSAVRNRLIPFNPCEDVQLPRERKKDSDGVTITREELRGKLLPTLPDRYRALVGTAAGTGLRWGECIGLRWDCVDLDTGLLRVLRVAVEVAGTVSLKPYPKSKAGRRVVPLPPFVVELLTEHRGLYPGGDDGSVFTNTAGGPLRRTLFRARVWRPALVEAGLLGAIVTMPSGKFRAAWTDAAGLRHSQTFDIRRLAVAHLVKVVPGGLRFHDLRHSYATWMISDGVPVNAVQQVMGHEQASTTLNRYTHASHDGHARLMQTFADFLLTRPSGEGSGGTEKAP